MSILIRDMKMPKPKLTDMATVYDAYVLVSPNGDAAIVVENEDGWDSTEYPLISVPPHERLIDANALMLEIQEYIEEYGWETDEHGWHNEKWCAMKEAAMVIDAAPTVIPAEPPKEENQ